MAGSSFFVSPLKRELRDDLAIEVYIDESSQNGHQHLVIGALEFKKKASIEIFRDLASVRGEYTGEVKWKKLSDQKAQHYRRWVDKLFELIAARSIKFHALTCDCTQFDHKRYNSGDGEIGFSKLLYQLLLHRIGKPALGVRPVYGYLDSRTTKHDPDNLRNMLNAGLAKHHQIFTQPFRRLTFIDSRKCDAIQAVDLLCGALAWDRNRRGEREEARQCKKELCEYIVNRSQERHIAWGFNIWTFQFRNRVPPA